MESEKKVRPVAEVRERQKWRTTANIDRTTGKPQRVTAGTETVRIGHCPENHDGKWQQSSRFEGVNEAGWIFWCAYGGHLFINTPPGEEQA